MRTENFEYLLLRQKLLCFFTGTGLVLMTCKDGFYDCGPESTRSSDFGCNVESVAQLKGNRDVLFDRRKVPGVHSNVSTTGRFRTDRVSHLFSPTLSRGRYQRFVSILFGGSLWVDEYS